MSNRRTISTRDKVSIAIRQTGQMICPLCHSPMTTEEPRILEHYVPRALLEANGHDPDALDNLCWVHKRCAHAKTYGNRATSAGGDIHKIRKSERLEIAQKAKKEVETKLTKKRWRLKRKMDGSVVKVRTR